MNDASTFEPIAVDSLLARVRELQTQGYRLVQIGATALPDGLELTYSFDREIRLVNLRLHVPTPAPQVPSISGIYLCAFIYENELHDLFNLRVNDMAVDFQGRFYKTSVKYPFGSPKAPSASPAPTPAPAPKVEVVRRDEPAKTSLSA
jgi:ech hydrogenase subunit D